MGSFGTDPVRKCLEEDSNPVVHRLRVNIGVCGIVKADSNKDFEDSNNGFERETVERRDLLNCIASNKDMWAYMLTKEIKLPEALENILTRNVMNIKNNAMNEVKAHGQDVRMRNIRNRVKPDIDSES